MMDDSYIKLNNIARFMMDDQYVKLNHIE